MTQNKVNQCQRCGTCCLKGGPALHRTDLDLYFEKHLSKEHLLTLRKGELAFDNVQNRVISLDEEIIRVRSDQDSRACIFFDASQNACRIYAHRPWECRALKCWDTGELEMGYAKHRLKRLDVIKRESALGEIISDHEDNCSYAQITKLVSDIKKNQDNNALKKLDSILKYDQGLRGQLFQKAGASQHELDFLLGRSLETTLPGLGLEVQTKGDGESGYIFRDKLI